MQVIENFKVKEKLYTKKLDNGLTIMIIPKKDINKKYAVIGTNFGSIDNKFIAKGEDKITEIPDGVAHFLEHKMFEQSDETNSLDTLSALGVEANAYTTNNHTAYLFECNENFYEAFDELMNYVQNPYFTDENVEKEKGIIAQEIKMYDDDPGYQVYKNAIKCMYNEFPIKIDIAGSVESIIKIDKEVLYKCYNTFYNPSNMALVICGDFEIEEILNEIEKRVINKKSQGKIERIYPKEDIKVKLNKIETNMEVSNPLFLIGIKDKVDNIQEMVKKHISIEILLEILFGKSSKLYKKLYENGEILYEPELEYEFSKNYAHILIGGQSKNPENVCDKFVKTIEEFKKSGIEKEVFERVKRKIYGKYILEYNDVSSIAIMFLNDYFKGINSFDYLEEYNNITIEYLLQILKEIFKEENIVLSIIKSN